MIRFLLITVLLGVASICAQPTLAVLDVQAKGFADRNTQISLQERITAIAKATQKANVISVEDYRKRALDQSVLVPVECDAQCFAEIGAKLGVDLILQPEVTRVDYGLAVKLKLFDVAGKRLVREESPEAGGNIGALLQNSVVSVLSSSPTKSESADVSDEAWVAGGIGAGMAVVLAALLSTAPIDDKTTAENHYSIQSPLVAVNP